jgi:hypothetical protein
MKKRLALIVALALPGDGDYQTINLMGWELAELYLSRGRIEKIYELHQTKVLETYQAAEYLWAEGLYREATEICENQPSLQANYYQRMDMIPEAIIALEKAGEYRKAMDLVRGRE